MGSSQGIMPPEGVLGPDLNRILPNPVQVWLWEQWVHFWGWAGALRQEHDARGLVALVGDLFESKKFAEGAQIISQNMEPRAYIADRTVASPELRAPMADFQPEAIAVIRGTEVHVGPVGESEEAFARSIKAARRPDGAWSWWVWRPEIHGVLLDFRHHPSNYGTKPWTDQAAPIREAKQVFYEHCERGERPPALAVRGHVHYHGDSGDACRTRAIFLPPWQFKTMHAHKVASNAIARFGGIAVLIQPDGTYTVHKQLYKPAEPEPWRMT